MRRVLVVDDEPKVLRLVGGLLEEAGHAVERCSSAKEAAELLEREIFDLLITDVRLPGGSGVALLEHARQVCPETQVVLITAFGTIPEAVRAMRLGAVDYLQKPFEMEALRRLVERTLEAGRLREEVSVLRAAAGRDRGPRALVGSSGAMQSVVELVRKVAPTKTTVLLHGESGSGKDVAAEMIHRLSAVGLRALLRVNCLAIPAELMESELFGHVRGAFTGAQESRKGWFELASGGTLLLDEISGLTPALQGKLLRVLEDGMITRVGSSKPIPVQVRILAASNQDLRALADQGRFREDLYYRLNVFPIRLPPLRDRREDIPELIAALSPQIARRIGQAALSVQPDTIEALAAYGWPGNVRELRNILERAAILAAGAPIALQHLPVELFDEPPAAAGAPSSFAGLVERYKVQVLRDALREAQGVKKDAAERLGLSPRALSHYIGKYGLDE